MDGYRPLNQSLKMNNTIVYTLPAFEDRENNPIYKSMNCTPPVKAWAELTSDNKIMFSPTKWNFLGHYDCILTLSDTRNASSFYFYIDVLNFPPKFANGMKP